MLPLLPGCHGVQQLCPPVCQLPNTGEALLAAGTQPVGSNVLPFFKNLKYLVPLQHEALFFFVVTGVGEIVQAHPR